MHRTRSATSALLVLAALLLGACGGGNDDDGGEASSGPDTSAPATDATDASGSASGSVSGSVSGSEPAGTIPPFSLPKLELKPFDGTIRFVNFFRETTTGTPVDVYYGYSAEVGEKIATLEYGQVGEFVPMKVESDPLLRPADGSTEMRVAIQRSGDTTREGQLQLLTQTVKPGARWTVVIAASRSFDATKPNSLSTQLAQEESMAAAPAGKALLFLNNLGIQAIEGGDFMSVGPAGDCSQPWSINNDLQSGNAGTTYVVDPGALKLIAHDANQDCATATPAIDVPVAAGDRFYVFAYGSTKQDRAIQVLKIAP